MWMKKFSRPFRFKDVDIALSRTLLIKNIPPHMASNQTIRRHFDEAYPDLTVTQVNVAYNVSELIKKTRELRLVKLTREAAENCRDSRGKPLRMFPRKCSFLCGCFCRCCSEKVTLLLSNFGIKNILIRWMLLNTTPRRRLNWRKRSQT